MFGLNLPQLIVILGLVLALAELAIGIDAGFDLVVIGSILVVSGLLGTVTSLIVSLICAIVLVGLYFFFGRRLIKSLDRHY